MGTDLPPLTLKSAGPNERQVIPLNVPSHRVTVRKGGKANKGGPRRMEGPLQQVFKQLEDADGGRTTPVDDLWDDLHGVKCPLTPRYDLDYLAGLARYSNILGAVIKAMSENVAGHGHRLELREELTDDDRVRYEAEIEAERLRLGELLAHIHYDDSLAKLRRTFRRRMEKVGFGAFEVVTDQSGAPAILEPLRSQNLRPCPKDKEMVLWDQPVYDHGKLQWTKRVVPRRFRRWVYLRTRTKDNRVYLREWGDPRVLDSKTGDFYPPGHPIDPATGRIVLDAAGNLGGRPANEVIVLGIDDDETVVPLPRYVGCLAELTTSWYGNQTNLARFENPIPPMLVLVSGGTLTDESWQAVTEHFEEAQDLENVGAPLVIQATMSPEAAAAAIAGVGGVPSVKLEVVPLDRVMAEDGLYQTMDANNRLKVRACWGLSPVATGESQDFSRAAANAGRSHDETDVYAPARHEEDEALFAKRLLPRWGIRFWRVVTNASPSLGDEDLPDLLREGREGRALTVNDTRRVLAGRLRVPLQPVEEPWGDLPAAFLADGFLSTEEVEAYSEIDHAERTAGAAAGAAANEPGGQDAEGSTTGVDDDGDDVEEAAAKRQRKLVKLAAKSLGVEPAALLRASKAARGETTVADVQRQVKELAEGLNAATDALVPRHDA